jgi:hypothetical protein
VVSLSNHERPFDRLRANGFEANGLSGFMQSATIQLAFADGSLGTIHYFANGSKSFPKERLEIFAAGRVLQLDNFRRDTPR